VEVIVLPTWATFEKGTILFQSLFDQISTIENFLANSIVKNLSVCIKKEVPSPQVLAPINTLVPKNKYGFFCTLDLVK
jgi:hypothetical protein